MEVFSNCGLNSVQMKEKDEKVKQIMQENGNEVFDEN